MTGGLPEETWSKLNVSRESRERIQAYVSLLLAWQEQINLVAPSTVATVWERHVLDSLQILPLLPHGHSSFADLGSGGGFPALPLAIVTGATAHLYESNGKKAAFLREALRISGATGVVHMARIEAAAPQSLPRVGLVTARALAPLTELLGLAEPFLAQGATGLFHKGESLDAELTEALKSWRIKSRTHRSLTDSRAFILEVEEARREQR
jgi:16S rRNA (guanine527-N7)-methyltransferase